jgi:hypothetical protein
LWLLLAALPCFPQGKPNFLVKFDPAGKPTASSIIFDSGVNLGIGTTNPKARFEIRQLSPSAPYFAAIRLSNALNVQPFTDLILDSDGNLGVGKADPKAKLDVEAFSGLAGRFTLNSPNSGSVALGAVTNGHGGAISGTATADGVGVAGLSSNGIAGLFTVLNAQNANPGLEVRHSGAGPGGLLRGRGDPLLVLNHTGATGNPALWFQQDGNNKAFIWWDRTKNRLNLGSSMVNPIVSLENTGNVGIGTDDPQTKLHVVGTVRTNIIEITGGSDLAEPFEMVDEIEPGMLVVIDPEQPGQLRIAHSPYDRTVAGIVSGANGVSPGLTMRQGASVSPSALPVALTGRVYCWADASYGAIEPGTLLTSSATPGHAMKVQDHSAGQGAIVGKAMSRLMHGRGLVLVLVSLQ